MSKHWTVPVAASLVALLASFAPTPLARADIFQWEYINPTDPGLGKQPSATLAPDGASVHAEPGANLSNRNLTTAYLIGENLQSVYATNVMLPNADLSYANLLGAALDYATLTGANFSHANLTVAYLRAANLTNAELSQANLVAARFSGFVYYSEVYISYSEPGANLTGANLSGADARGADFSFATLNSANLSEANLTNANFSGDGYYTPAADLSGANLIQADARGANFSGATLNSANLSEANLTNANFSSYSDGYGTNYTDLTGANLSGADARGANFQYATLSGANPSNLIQSDGHIAGLDLTAGASLVVRDYDGNSGATPPTGPLPTVVEQQLSIDVTGKMRLVFDADPWDSTISFAPGIPVALGGMLELTFAPGVNVATQSGLTIDLFDWTGVTPTGAFTVSSPYTWDLSDLYTTGEVTLTAVPSLPGDFNNDGAVDAADYVVWRKQAGTQTGYNAWRANFGQHAGSGFGANANAAVPEPTALIMFVAALIGRSIAYLRQCHKLMFR